jgi:hypothetical protein
MPDEREIADAGVSRFRHHDRRTRKNLKRPRPSLIDQACAGDGGARGREAMDGEILFRLLRMGLHGTALALGSVGVFLLCFSCMGAPVAGHAVVCLGSATVIVLASNRKAGS